MGDKNCKVVSTLFSAFLDEQEFQEIELPRNQKHGTHIMAENEGQIDKHGTSLKKKFAKCDSYLQEL